MLTDLSEQAMEFGKKGETGCKSWKPQHQGGAAPAPSPSKGPPCRAAELLQRMEGEYPCFQLLLCSPSTICCVQLENIAGEVSQYAVLSALGFAPPGVDQTCCPNAA